MWERWVRFSHTDLHLPCFLLKPGPFQRSKESRAPSVTAPFPKKLCLFGNVDKKNAALLFLC